MSWASKIICHVLHHNIFTLAENSGDLCTFRLVCRAWDECVTTPTVVFPSSALFEDPLPVPPNAKSLVVPAHVSQARRVCEFVSGDDLIDSIAFVGSQRAGAQQELVEAIAEMLRANKSLTELRISAPQIALADSSEIFRALLENRLIRKVLFDGLPSGDSALSLFANCKLIREVSYEPELPEDIGKLAVVVAQSRSMTRLNLSMKYFGTQAGSDSSALTAAFLQNSTLQEIYASEVETRADLEPLAAALHPSGSVSIFHLRGRQQSRTGAQNLVLVAEALKRSATLTDLLVATMPLTDFQLAALADAIERSSALKRLKIFDLGSNPSAFHHLIVCIKCSKAPLEYLSLRVINHRDNLSGLVSKHISLNTLRLCGSLLSTDMERWVDALVSLPLLTKLRVDFTFDSLEILPTLLSSDKFPHLNSLSVDCDFARDRIAAVDVSPLRTNSTLRNLTLAWECSAKILADLFAALESNTSLLTLRVQAGILSSDDAEPRVALCRMITRNRGIQCLNLSALAWKFELLLEISKALCLNPTLKKVVSTVPYVHSIAGDPDESWFLNTFHGGNCLNKYLTSYKIILANRTPPWRRRKSYCSQICPCCFLWA